MGFAKSLSKFEDDSVSYALKEMSRTPEQRQAKAKRQATKMSVQNSLGRMFYKQIKADHKAEIQEYKDDNPNWAVTDAEYLELKADHKLEKDEHKRLWKLKK